MPRSRLLQIIMLLAVNLVVPVGAASLDEAQRCASQTDDRARLACYDQVFGRPPGASAQPLAGTAAAAANPGPSSGHSAEALPANPEADFGLSAAAKQARDPEKAKQYYPDSIAGKVATVGHRPTGELIVTLVNGQVWAQMDPDTRATVKAGDSVTIKRAALGSYLLVTASNMATRVKRLK